MSDNLVMGVNAGKNSRCSLMSTIVGNYAGENDVNGYSNVYIGNSSGKNAINSYNNTFLGALSGKQQSGHNNIYIGESSGSLSKGNHNILIGSKLNCTSSNILCIGNSSSYTGNPFIMGNMNESTRNLNVDANIDVAGTLKMNSMILQVYSNVDEIDSPQNGQLIVKNDNNSACLSVYLNSQWIDLASHSYQSYTNQQSVRISPILTSDDGNFINVSSFLSDPLSNSRHPWHIFEGSTQWSDAVNNNRIGWLSEDSILSASLTYDFTISKTITSIEFHNYTEYFDTITNKYTRGADNIIVSVSDDNVNFTYILHDTGRQSSSSWSSTISSTQSGRYVKIEIDNINGGVSHVGLLEVIIYGY